MKTLFFVLVFGACAPALAANPPQGTTTNNGPAVAKAPAKGGGYWRRMPNGRMVWVAPATDVSKTARENSQQRQANAGNRIYSHYRPTVVTTYPDTFRPEVVNGVDWYLNGRSFFSD